MNENRCVDLNTMGEHLIKMQLQVPPAISENLVNIFECMAYANPERKIIKVMPKKNETNEKKSGNKDVMSRLAEMN